MSFYTGRYVQSHGATWNGVPLKVGEMTLGDYLRPLGVDCVLVGKTHMRADQEGMERLGIDPNSVIGVRVAECGFDPYERDDGLQRRTGEVYSGLASAQWCGRWLVAGPDVNAAALAADLGQ